MLTPLDIADAVREYAKGLDATFEFSEADEARSIAAAIVDSDDVARYCNGFNEHLADYALGV